MESASYLLCLGTAAACGVLLLRAYRGGRTPLLLWSGLFFLALAAENGLLFVDRIVVPNVDLWALRRAVGVGGIALLVYGLIWEVDRKAD